MTSTNSAIAAITIVLMLSPCPLVCDISFD
jgi:hypothetical protein